MRPSHSYLLKVGFALAILALIFSHISWLEVARALIAADPALVLGAMLVACVQMVTSAVRLKLLTDWHGMSLSVPLITRINFVTQFYGLVLPGELAAGAIRWHRLNQVERKGAQVFAALVFARLVFMAVLTMSGIAFLLLDATARAHGVGMLVPLGLILLGVTALTAVGFNPTVLRRLLRLGRGLPIPSLIWHGIEKVAAAAEHYHGLSWRRIGALIAVSFMENLLGIVHLAMMAWAIGLGIGLAAAGWLRSIVQIVAMVPISFAGLGVREGTLIVLLEPYGVAAAAAVALSFLLLARILVLAAIGGLLEGVRWLRPRTVLSSAAAPAEDDRFDLGMPRVLMVGLMRTWREVRSSVSVRPPH